MARTIKAKGGKGKTEPVSIEGKEIKSSVARKKSLSIKTPAVKQLPVEKKPRIRRHIEKEIKYYRSVTTHLVPKATFIKLLKKVVSDIGSELRFTKDSILMLQDAYESFITASMETSYLATAHAKRVTLKAIDFTVTRRIQQQRLF
ncbi:Histones H3 and H4 [Pseudoloma neurophilia]|uniref:Histones H3 and H4 n=1 Tax=Pseudoloma neurophilia TaxID=146866 RepID=A0A0R0LRC6_9MICR|nr:Histones H3 and H4 [Pseudoloma neurophilia]